MRNYIKKNKITLRPAPDALLNPKADPIFKILFTEHSKESRIALSEFLSTLIGEQVTQIKLLPNILTSESKEDRQTQFDLSCKIGYDKFANVEMQGHYHYSNFDNRVEYHIAHLLNHFVGRGTNWDKVPITYQISVMNFIYNKTSTNDINHYYMQTDDGLSLNKRMNIIFFELPKFRKYLNCDVEKLTSIQRWGLFFLYADSKEHIGLIKKLALEERGIMFAMKILSKISISDWFWVQQKNYWDNISNIKSMKSTARNEGLAEGRAEGSIETKLSNAKALISLGKLSLEEIASCCELPLEKVLELAKEVGK